MPVIATVLMTKAEARRAIDTVVRNAEEIAALILALHDREGWKALGYDSFHACMEQELGITRIRAYQLLEGARVNAILMLPDESTPALEEPLKESHARALSPLKGKPEVLRDAAATVRARVSKPRASDFQEEVAKRIGVPKPSSGNRKQSFQNDSNADPGDTPKWCSDCAETHRPSFDCMSVEPCNSKCPACCKS